MMSDKKRAPKAPQTAYKCKYCNQWHLSSQKITNKPKKNVDMNIIRANAVEKGKNDLVKRINDIILLRQRVKTDKRKPIFVIKELLKGQTVIISNDIAIEALKKLEQNLMTTLRGYNEITKQINEYNEQQGS